MIRRPSELCSETVLSNTPCCVDTTMAQHKALGNDLKFEMEQINFFGMSNGNASSYTS